MSPEKKRYTFLSYSRINKDFALKLAKELKAAGFPIWIDQLDIPTGARWDDELENALEECEIFMVILTPASISSENVKDEIGYAIDHNKRILPVLLEESKIPLRLRRFQYVDFSNKSYEEGVEAAKQLLIKISEPTIPVESAAPKPQKQDAPKEKASQLPQKAARSKPAEESPKKTASVEPETKSKRPVIEQKPKAETPSATSALKIPLPKPAIYGIGALAIIILAVILISALSGNGNSPTTPVETQTSTATQWTPTTAVLPTNTPKPATATNTATPKPTSTPTATPTFAPPFTPYVRILEITIDDQKNYVVEYETYGYTEALPGMHIHFFFDTVSPIDAGMPGSGPWKVYGGPSPFKGYKVSDRPLVPNISGRMCALVANSDHSVQYYGEYSCVDLP